MSEWQPIATAPKDETEVLLWAPDCYYIARWEAHIRNEFDDSTGNWTDGEGAITGATHWQPLAPPKVNP